MSHRTSAKRRQVTELVTAIALSIIALSACTDSRDEAPPVDVATLISDSTNRQETVAGVVVWDESGARLCQVLMESYPAQCGGPSVAITNPAAIVADFDESGGVRWTPSFVTLTGAFDGTRFTLI